MKKAVRYLTETVTRENGFTHMFIDNLNIVIQYADYEKMLECHWKHIKKIMRSGKKKQEFVLKP